MYEELRVLRMHDRLESIRRGRDGLGRQRKHSWFVCEFEVDDCIACNLSPLPRALSCESKPVHLMAVDVVHTVVALHPVEAAPTVDASALPKS